MSHAQQDLATVAQPQYLKHSHRILNLITAAQQTQDYASFTPHVLAEGLDRSTSFPQPNSCTRYDEIPTMTVAWSHMWPGSRHLVMMNTLHVPSAQEGVHSGQPSVHGHHRRAADTPLRSAVATCAVVPTECMG